MFDFLKDQELLARPLKETGLNLAIHSNQRLARSKVHEYLSPHLLCLFKCCSCPYVSAHLSAKVKPS
jgi:hypothetical protein